MAEIVLDANVIVALLYADDSLHQRAVHLTTRLVGEGHSFVLVDLLVFEALSVICRRAAQRKTAPPDLAAAVERTRSWAVPCPSIWRCWWASGTADIR